MQVRTDENGNTVASATIQAVVLWKKISENYIMDEIIKMCKEHGITDLYVLNQGDFMLVGHQGEEDGKGDPAMTREEAIKVLSDRRAMGNRFDREVH